MTASTVTGRGPGSADGKNRGSQRDTLGVEHLIGTRAIYAGKVDLDDGGDADVKFEKALPGVASDYIVLTGGDASHSWASALTVNGFHANGGNDEVVSWVLFRITNASVTGGPPGSAV